MIVEGLAIGELPGETVGAMHGLGRKGVGTVQGHQQLIVKEAKMRQHMVLLKALKNLHKHGIQVARRNRIEELAHLIVTGNLLHVEQGMGIIAPLCVLQPALVLQKRRRLGEKDAKGAQGGIMDGVSGVGPLFAMVRQVSEPSVQDALENIEASGGCHDSLLRSVEIDTLTRMVSIGNLKPFTSQN